MGEGQETSDFYFIVI